MKLVACQDCHAQYDVAPMVPGSEFDCRCGSTLEATPPAGVDAAVKRCSSCGAVARDDAESCDYCASEIVREPQRGHLICPECMARNLDDARFCLACGTQFAPQAVLNDQPELRCPSCECWMDAREVAGLVVQECGKCHGLWAPDDAFDVLVERTTRAAQDRAREGEELAPRVEGGNPVSNRVEYRRCPSCDALMGRKNYRKRSGVIIDRCHDHGTWLDADELERIAGWILSGKAQRAGRLEASQSEERARAAAREAATRIQMGGIENRSYGTSGSDYSIFGGRREPNTVGTVLDLLSALFR